MSRKLNHVEFKGAMIRPWRGDPIVFVTAGIECANMMVVRNVHKDRLDFVSPMGAVDVALILVVIRAPAINSFVQLMAVVRGASLKVATSQQWEVPIYAQLMVAVVGVRWKVVTSQRSLRRNSVSNTVVGRNVRLQVVKRYHVDVLNFVLLMGVVCVANLQAAIGLRLEKYNFVEHTGVELDQSRKPSNHFRAEKSDFLCHLILAQHLDRCMELSAYQ